MNDDALLAIFNIDHNTGFSDWQHSFREYHRRFNIGPEQRLQNFIEWTADPDYRRWYTAQNLSARILKDRTPLNKKLDGLL